MGEMYILHLMQYIRDGEKALDRLHTDAWVCDLADKLEAMRDVIGLKESEKRKQNYDRGNIERELKVGELILCRIYS